MFPCAQMNAANRQTHLMKFGQMKMKTEEREGEERKRKDTNCTIYQIIITKVGHWKKETTTNSPKGLFHT